ncbi:MAG: hypothetical protein GMKNLPBB_00016 [Myxococcota bacterium]|nr:hypothetical protein [Myxococcota bacterium]
MAAARDETGDREDFQLVARPGLKPALSPFDFSRGL